MSDERVAAAIKRAQGRQLPSYPVCLNQHKYPDAVGGASMCPVCGELYNHTASTHSGVEHVGFHCGGGWWVGVDWLTGQKAWVGRCGKQLVQQEIAYE